MRLRDGGFEQPTFGVWKFSGDHTGYDSTHVHAGLSACRLIATSIPQIPPPPLATNGDAIQAVAATPGETLSLSGWLYPGSFPPGDETNVQLWADTTSGNGSALGMIETFDISALPAGWGPHIWPPIVAHAPFVYLDFRLTAPTMGGQAFLWMDDLALVGDEDVAKRSRWLAHQRLVADLKGINGAAGGYFTDLQGRVYTKYLRPAGAATPPLPYICAPLVNSAPQVSHDGTWLQHSWVIPIMLFVAETNVGAFDSNAISALYHLGEDVYQAVMRDPFLNNTVQVAEFVSGAIEEGGISPFDGLPYADAIVPLRLQIKFGLDVIGP